MNAPTEFAPGVYRLLAGSGPLRANVYFVRAHADAAVAPAAGAVWVLIDTGVSRCGPEIHAAAESLFGAGATPAAILITHAHPDHAGSAPALAREWQCPVYLHPEELRKKCLLTAASHRGLGAYAQALEAADAGATGGPVPHLPEWQAISCPGHTPGHVAFFRPRDRVLISGDAVLTQVEPFSALFGKRATVSGPPWYFTWNRGVAKLSIGRLAALEPLVIAGGHGRPKEGADLAAKLNKLAADY